MTVDKTILLTGATGFIGSNLLKRLIKNGEKDVHIIVRKNSSPWRIEDIEKSYKLHILNLTEFDEVKDFVAKLKPDIIFHLAAHGVDFRKQDYHQAVKVNISSSIALFESFCENKGCRFIHTGSCFEYGELKKNKPISEKSLLNPTNIYNITKASAVQLLCSMASRKLKYGNLVILRPFSIYGEFERNNRFFPYVIRGLNKRQPVPLTKSEQIKDYVYVGDVVNAYILSAQAPLKNKVEIINIGSGNGISMKEIALKIAKQMGANENLLKFGALDYLPNEIMYNVADIKKSKKLLGWEPKTSLEKGIKKMIKWHSEGLNGSRKEKYPELRVQNWE